MSRKNLPAYLRIAEDLKKKIKLNHFEVGNLIPSELELQQEYSASRTTIRNSMEILENEGLILRKQGRGTTLVSRHAVQNLTSIGCFTDALKEKGIIPETGLVSIRKVHPNPNTAEILQISTDSYVYSIQRTKLVEGKVFGFLNSRIVADLVPDFDEHIEDIRKNGLYETLEEKYKLQIHSATETIAVHMSSDFENEVFEIAESIPLFQNERITMLSTGKPFEHATTFVRTENFEYRVALQGRKKPSIISTIEEPSRQ